MRLGEFRPGQKKPLMAMVEVTNRCNMQCPVCFANANHHNSDLPIPKIRQNLEQLLELTGSPIPIQISGGEPTVRDDLPQIISLTKKLGYRHVELITNGIKISNSSKYLKELKKDDFEWS